MGALSNDQSMEEILSSIKRIIADEDNARAAGMPRPPRRKPAIRSVPAPEVSEDDQILELTDAIMPEESFADVGRTSANVALFPVVEKPEAGESDTMVKPPRNATTAETGGVAANSTAAEAAVDAAPAVISDSSAAAVREALSSLSSLLIKPADAPSNTLEGLVQEMLRPMLKEWLDTNLPGLVETMVKREIEKITGRV
jgi:cell pole-organizing protein PopZ